MTLGTIYRFVCAYEGEGSFVVHFGDVLYDPTLRGVTARAIISYRLIMHVLVTSNTRRRCFFEA
jgi:hypothetical protein